MWLINLVGDFSLGLGISLWSWGFLGASLIRACMGHRVRVLGDFSVEMGISLWFLIRRSVVIE